MGIMSQWKEFRSYKENRATLEDILLQAGLMKDSITKSEALEISTVSACVELISNTVAVLPIKLYKDIDGKVEIIRDNRVNLLNEDTRDTLDGFQFKKAVVEDYLLNGAGYAYISKDRNDVKSLHYVDNGNVSISINTDPIFKSYDMMVNGETYRDFEFVKVTRKTKDGVTGAGILKENKVLLSVSYNSMSFENTLVKTGGNKKGFLKSGSRLSDDAMKELKKAWNDMYRNNTESVIILNEGLSFQEASSTSIEMQINENKITNATEICRLFNVPPALLDGARTSTDAIYNNFIKIAILPILKAIETALNKDLLLPSEKESFYFAFDTKDLLKGDMEKRYKAYEIAVRNKILGINEIRYEENKEPIEALEDIVVLGLQDVLYNTKTGEVYTPNTDKISNMNSLKTLKGGE